MFTFLVVITSALFLLLLVVAGIRPQHALVSRFELERRSKKDRDAKVALRREKLLPDVLSLQQVVIALLLVAVVLLSVVTFGWLIGVIASVVIVLLYGSLARLAPIAFVSRKVYGAIEPRLLRAVKKFHTPLRLIRSVSPESGADYHRFDSREELQQLIQNSSDVLTDNQRRLLVNGLSFPDVRVESIMTPRLAIKTIKKSEFLGPLVLSELHNAGLSRLPVITTDVDHVVGILHLRDLLSLDIKRSVTAEKAMEAKVYYIRHDDTLEHALAAFLKTRHHLFIVINEARETVGLVTLEDVIEALLGRKILDEDDNHENLREIATRQAKTRNLPENHVDI